MSGLTVAALAGKLAAGRRADLALTLDFNGYRIAVRTDSVALRDKLAFYFKDFLAASASADVAVTALEGPAPDPADLAGLGVSLTVKQPDPGKTKIKEEFADLADGRLVRKRITGLVFLFGGGVHLALGPCAANDNQVVNFINNRFIQWTLDAGCLLFHAAGVAPAGRGQAQARFSGMGKSTLALHAMNHGLDFVSNDRLMVRRNGALTMYGLAKMPRINPGTVLHNPALAPVMPEADRRRFAALPPDELWSLEHKVDAFIDQCFGPGRFRLSAEMCGLVLLNWQRDGGPLHAARVDLRQRPDLLPAFMKDVGLFYSDNPDLAAPDFSAEAYLDLLDGCPVYELTGGADFAAAAQLLLDYF